MKLFNLSALKDLTTRSIDLAIHVSFHGCSELEFISLCECFTITLTVHLAQGSSSKYCYRIELSSNNVEIESVQSVSDTVTDIKAVLADKIREWNESNPVSFSKQVDMFEELRANHKSANFMRNKTERKEHLDNSARKVESICDISEVLAAKSASNKQFHIYHLIVDFCRDNQEALEPIYNYAMIERVELLRTNLTEIETEFRSLADNETFFFVQDGQVLPTLYTKFNAVQYKSGSLDTLKVHTIEEHKDLCLLSTKKMHKYIVDWSIDLNGQNELDTLKRLIPHVKGDEQISWVNCFISQQRDSLDNGYIGRAYFYDCFARGVIDWCGHFLLSFYEAIQAIEATPPAPKEQPESNRADLVITVCMANDNLCFMGKCTDSKPVVIHTDHVNGIACRDDIFKAVEQYLINAGIAHNVSRLDHLRTCGESVDYTVTYNKPVKPEPTEQPQFTESDIKLNMVVVCHGAKYKIVENNNESVVVKPMVNGLCEYWDKKALLMWLNTGYVTTVTEQPIINPWLIDRLNTHKKAAMMNNSDWRHEAKFSCILTSSLSLEFSCHVGIERQLLKELAEKEAKQADRVEYSPKVRALMNSIDDENLKNAIKSVGHMMKENGFRATTRGDRFVVVDSLNKEIRTLTGDMRERLGQQLDIAFYMTIGRKEFI